MSRFKKQNIKRALQLKQPFGTANNKLKKSIMFFLAKKCNMDLCFRCGNRIDNISEFTIEHKINWLDSENPVKLFFDVENIAFSHHHCNVKVARKISRIVTHGNNRMYTTYGCRCVECKSAHAAARREYRARVGHQ